MTDARQPTVIVAVALFFVFTIAALVPLHNYDFFWHLATGRWIVEHRALPLTDPFAVASDRAPWINGEWLFEVLLYPLQRAIGFAGLSVARALLAAAMFTMAFVVSARDRGRALACAAAVIAFVGANRLLDLRPSSVAPLLLVLAILFARRSPILFVIVTIVWINIHPSALIAPIVMLLMTRSISKTLASFAALFVNPFGWHAIAAPVALNAFVTSGAFVNAEWQRSAPLVFPLLYACVIAVAILFVLAKERHVGEIALIAMLALMAVLHVRHQPLFFAAMPLLLPRIEVPRIAYIVAAAAMVLVIFTTPIGVGFAAHRWPFAAVARLNASGLRGNVYNPDQFGGLLIWSFYPQRRALTDGRNELYRTFIGDYAVARNDSRAWHALLRKYKIDLAVDEYRRAAVPVVDMQTKKTTLTPASLVYWPRTQWALIGYDDVGMVFARRAAFSQEQLQNWEIRGVVPDAIN